MEEHIAAIENLIMSVTDLIEEGAMAIRCNRDMVAVSHPVVVDNLVISNLRKEGGEVVFDLGWRSIGITEEFESGAFNVERPEFIRIDRYEIKDNRILFYHQKIDDSRRILCLAPIDDEHRPEWDEWKLFKQRRRDYFEELDIEMADILNSLGA